MYEGIFASTTIPILEQVASFAQARHVVLAGNIANVDTPGYWARDLDTGAFRERLQEAIAARRRTGPVSPGDVPARAQRELAEVARNPRSILRHDDANVGLEYQVTEMVKNQLQHNLALAIMTSQFRLLGVAISERA